MRIQRVVATTAVGAMAIAGLAACGSSGKSTPKTSGSTSPSSTTSPATSASGNAAVKPSGVLHVGMPNGPQTENYNPFLGSSAGASLGFRAMIYEPLVMFNPIDPAKDGVPWLASAWKWTPDYKSVAITVRDGVKWSDGQPMTADDVAYTFQLLKDNASINGNAIPFGDISTSGNVVTVTFTASQFVNQQKVLSQIIVPKHIWSTAGDPSKFTDTGAIGTGPYTVKSFTPQTITLDVRDSYWQTLPQVAELQYTSYTDNNSETTALANGEAEWGFVFIPDVKNVYESKDPANNKIWFPPNLGVHGLWINTTKAPFDDPNLRNAMNMVVNRDDIFQKGEAGYFYPVVDNITGIPTPAGNSFISDKYKSTTVSVDVAGAKKLLTDNGYKLNGNTLLDKNGKPVTLTLSDPAGWSDYQTDLTIIQGNLAQIGIKATVDKANQDAWFKNVDTGNFDAVMHWTNGGATPYDMYENIMDGAILKPVGTSGVAGNYGRFKSDAATQALQTYANASDDATRKAALDQIEDIFVQQMPVLITSAANVGAEYNTKNWVGWPDESNPYAPPQPTQQNALQVVLALKPAK
ncbi:MAG: ABC transporter substrate-binding protein [Acidothermaceae bacterium]